MQILRLCRIVYQVGINKGTNRPVRQTPVFVPVCPP